MNISLITIPPLSDINEKVLNTLVKENGIYEKSYSKIQQYILKTAYVLLSILSAREVLLHTLLILMDQKVLCLSSNQGLL